jgi:D-aminoacyl-tRNA deacylase
MAIGSRYNFRSLMDCGYGTGLLTRTVQNCTHRLILNLALWNCMRALVQRVASASVVVNGKIASQIGKGLLVFVGVRHDDTTERAEKLADKVTRLRIFPDEAGKMNLSVSDVGGELMIVSQFTLYGDTAKGNRPSYSDAANPEAAQYLYEHFVSHCRSKLPVATGIFQAHMEVHLVNDGPVTLMCYAES